MKFVIGFAITVLAALSVLAGTTTAGQSEREAQRASKVFVPCFRLGSGDVRYQKRPDRCDFAPPGCPAALCVNPFKDIKWKSSPSFSMEFRANNFSIFLFECLGHI